MHGKEQQAALLVILVILIIFVGGMGLLWYFSSKTSTIPLPTSAVTDTTVTVSPLPAHSYRTASFSGNPISIELATTTAAQELGLGNRPNIADNYGMLFVFSNDGNYGFWMKDMEAPLDMYWLSDKGVVTTAMANVATSTYPNVLYPKQPARYVLETKAGYGAEHGIHEGSILSGLPFLPTVLK